MAKVFSRQKFSAIRYGTFTYLDLFHRKLMLKHTRC